MLKRKRFEHHNIILFFLLVVGPSSSSSSSSKVKTVILLKILFFFIYLLNNFNSNIYPLFHYISIQSNNLTFLSYFSLFFLIYLLLPYLFLFFYQIKPNICCQKDTVCKVIRSAKLFFSNI